MSDHYPPTAVKNGVWTEAIENAVEEAIRNAKLDTFEYEATDVEDDDPGEPDLWIAQTQGYYVGAVHDEPDRTAIVTLANRGLQMLEEIRRLRNLLESEQRENRLRRAELTALNDRLAWSNVNGGMAYVLRGVGHGEVWQVLRDARDEQRAMEGEAAQAAKEEP
jgi:hypothetical protein